MLVDVLPQLFLLAHNARAGVAEDRAADSGKSADLDSSEDSDRPAEAHAHEGPDHGQAGHGDGGVVVVGVVVFDLFHPGLDCCAILENFDIDMLERDGRDEVPGL